MATQAWRIRVAGAVMFTAGACGTGTEQPKGAPGGEPIAESWSAINTTLKNASFSDANGWNQVFHYATIRYPDLDGNGRSDVCGRGTFGITCARDDGTGAFGTESLWTTSFNNTDGWTAPQYYRTIQFPNLNAGSNFADVCGRGIAGIHCALSNGTSFGTVNLWNSDFSDANGWNAAQHYSTIRFPDLNNDGRADVCGRGTFGMTCALSTGSTFGAVSLWTSAFSNAAGFTAAQYYSTIRFPDLNSDNRADVCGRGPNGITCALSNGTSFGTPTLWNADMSDANGWSAAMYYETIQFADLNGDNRDDLCGRGIAGMLCALSTGSTFGALGVWSENFSDAAGWSGGPQYWSTIKIVDKVICGRGFGGINCGYSNGTNHFDNVMLDSGRESDPVWTVPEYYSTFDLTADLKLADRGPAGIYTGPVFPADQLSISSVTQLNARRTALITKVWGTSSLNTTQGVDSSGPPESIEVSPLPPGTTVTRYKINMPTSGGIPVPGGPAAVQGIADHFVPSGGSSKLVILNPGHDCHYNSFPYQDSETVIEMLNAGFEVLATYMPILTPLQCGGSHDALFDPTSNQRPANGAHPLIYFLDPVRRSLNHVLAQKTYAQVDMAGLSGGGWTTTFYAALDTRIKTSILVAPGLPFYMRPQSDAEQENRPEVGNDFFDFMSGGNRIVTGYKDLYLLGSYGAGRKQTQVLNRRDDCCFGEGQFKGAVADWDNTVRVYESEVRQRLQTLGAGSFRVEINEAVDPGFIGHQWSKHTRVGVVLTELDGATSLLGAKLGQFPLARGMSGTLRRNTGTPGTWNDTGLAMVGTPAVVSGAISGHTFDLFYRNPEDQLTHAYYDGTSWIATTNLSGRLLSDPVATSWGSGRIDVVALDPDYKLQHWRYTGSWQAPVTVSTSTLGVGTLAMTSFGTNRLDIFFRGHDAVLKHATSNGAPPYTVTSTGSTLRGFPSAVSSSTNATHWVFFTNSSDRLIQLKQTNGGAWTATDVSSATGSTSTKVRGSPSVFRSGGGTITVYARVSGTIANALGRYVWNGTSWSFTNQGGAPLLGSPVANDLGAFIMNANTQGAMQLNTSQSWVSLGGYLDR